jgi:hypothetical protein
MRLTKYLYVSTFSTLAFVFHSVAFSQNKTAHETKHGESHAEGSLFETVNMGETKDSLVLKKHGNMYLSGAPSSTQMVALKKAGILAIADIRQPSENRAELQKASKENGMVYQNIPLFLPNSQNIDPKAVDAITSFHKTHHEGGHVIACASGNRSSAWFAAHMGKDHALPAEKAVAAGKEAFLREDMAEAVRKFLK